MEKNKSSEGIKEEETGRFLEKQARGCRRRGSLCRLGFSMYRDYLELPWLGVMYLASYLL